LVIALSSDIDWAPKKAINHFLDILQKFNANITIFAPHKIDDTTHEIAIHPNTTSGKNYSDAISELVKLFPNAKGCRMHGLQISSKLLIDLPKFGISYDSSFYIPNNENKPFQIFPNIVEIPIFWEDDLAMGNNSLKIDKLKIKEQENSQYLFVYDFHPIHVFMNTYDLEFYELWKSDYKNIHKLEKKRNLSKYGTENALFDILENIDTKKLSTLSSLKSFYI